MNATANVPLALDVRGVAALLGVSTRHIWTLHSAGKMPGSIQLGKRRLWRRDEIEQWLAAGAPDRETWEARKRGAA